MSLNDDNITSSQAGQNQKSSNINNSRKSLQTDLQGSDKKLVNNNNVATSSTPSIKK